MPLSVSTEGRIVQHVSYYCLLKSTKYVQSIVEPSHWVALIPEQLGISRVERTIFTARRMVLWAGPCRWRLLFYLSCPASTYLYENTILRTKYLIKNLHMASAMSRTQRLSFQATLPSTRTRAAPAYWSLQHVPHSLEVGFLVRCRSGEYRNSKLISGLKISSTYRNALGLAFTKKVYARASKGEFHASAGKPPRPYLPIHVSQVALLRFRPRLANTSTRRSARSLALRRIEVSVSRSASLGRVGTTGERSIVAFGS